MKMLEKIGFWYEKLPEHLRKKHFSHLGLEKELQISIDGQDEIDFTRYVHEKTTERFNGLLDDFVKFFAHYAIFMRGGKKVIKVVDASLKESLLNTGIDEMILDDLHLPFDSFFVELGLQYKYFNGTMQTIEGAFVFNYGEWLEIVALEYSSNTQLPTLVYFTIHKYTSIKLQITRIVSDIFLSTYRGTIASNFKDTLEDLDTGLISQIVKLFSILFYLDFAQKEFKSSIVEKNEWKPFMSALHKGKTTQFNGKRITAYHYINLGPIKTPSENKDADFTKTGSGHKQTKMTLVRGHWKKQPYGSKQQAQLAKTIWIRPYWKNLDSCLNDETHVYKIK